MVFRKILCMNTNSDVLEAYHRLVAYWDDNAGITQNWSEVAVGTDPESGNAHVVRVFIETGSFDYEQFRKAQVMKGAGIVNLVADVDFVESDPPVLL